jgi:hypothetical protein
MHVKRKQNQEETLANARSQKNTLGERPKHKNM